MLRPWYIILYLKHARADFDAWTVVQSTYRLLIQSKMTFYYTMVDGQRTYTSLLPRPSLCMDASKSSDAHKETISAWVQGDMCNGGCQTSWPAVCLQYSCLCSSCRGITLHDWQWASMHCNEGFHCEEALLRPTVWIKLCRNNSNTRMTQNPCTSPLQCSTSFLPLFYPFVCHCSHPSIHLFISLIHWFMHSYMHALNRSFSRLFVYFSSLACRTMSEACWMIKTKQ